jgi:hypothetical protein
MPFAWRPVAGQVALIEVAGEESCLTGIVVEGASAGDDSAVVVDLGGSPKPPSAPVEVIASFFAPDALYRVTATAVPHNGASTKIVDLRVQNVERVQRRTTPRTKASLPVVLSNFDDPGAMVSVVGKTLDVGMGGCRVQTGKAFPAGCDPTVTFTLDDGSTVVALGAVLQSQLEADTFEYRLVFLEMDDADRLRLSETLELVPLQ